MSVSVKCYQGRSVCAQCVLLTIAGLLDLVNVCATHMYVCTLARAQATLLLRLLNYEAFRAVVMAPSALGNMSFYFCLGPNIQFEESSQTIYDLFKRSNKGGKKMGSPQTPGS